MNNILEATIDKPEVSVFFLINKNDLLKSYLTDKGKIAISDIDVIGNTELVPETRYKVLQDNHRCYTHSQQHANTLIDIVIPKYTEIDPNLDYQNIIPRGRVDFRFDFEGNRQYSIQISKNLSKNQDVINLIKKVYDFPSEANIIEAKTHYNLSTGSDKLDEISDEELTNKLNARLSEINIFINDNNDKFKVPYDPIDLFEIDIDEWDGILEDLNALLKEQPVKKSVQMRESIRDAITLIKKQPSEF